MDFENEERNDFDDEEMGSYMDNRYVMSSESYVTVSEDNMKVTLNLSSPSDGTEYTVGDIIKILRHHDVTQGIDRDKLNAMIKGRVYFQDVDVAFGKTALDGDDGFFKYFFKTELSSIPKILEDGTVDYKDMELFEEVKAGQLLAEYVPATPGEFGYTVLGELLKPKRGKDIPQLRGKGFVLSEDKIKYTAEFDGIVELNDNYLEVKRLYTVDGDVDAQIGNIDFTGDVYVKGNVCSGYTIKAGGNVTVEGHVEAAEIYATKSILLKKGMQANGKGFLHAKESISGLFFESVTLRAGEELMANYLLNCDTVAGKKITISGKKGAIIGGRTKANQGIDCFSLGNIAEVPTIVEVGIDKVQMQQHQTIGKKLMKVDSEIKLFEEGIRKISLSSSQEEKTKKMYDKLMQAHQMKLDEREELLQERNSLMQKMDATNNSKVVVRGIVYGGCKVIIDTNPYIVQQAYKAVVFVRSGNKILALGD